ncbi:MAG: phage tail protein [Microcoleus sp. PH2017_10_PVI_O_A]|uniref:phage tail protein n=1 Tax=unclassified Microcoleus TaxID=2642155 RepID=UPI001DED762A|nr:MULTISPECIES: phage tail protein [unclassified Microcoleus]TAE85322.1 MAG: phage tail protein [Oscillatoriales cyanobacterium]MCC3404734.1 phage tail protein [Microcoleus sp. PH2017_10_PVI_O_A]MCC3458803.1 phage tail protein [Microcoleus sp. PH2017_11_PCY_U_A]MCC3477000.1 phage tail protein [Microcoleus sp. PH2017_12_PCY_D_A]MCC3558200.1 phage tail protein [Microcoleus sp. PH2017_27_LUM_O_A]
MISFGLIAEGLTDQIVIENILAGYFKSLDLDVEPLQPERDKDNQNKSKYGGWTLVFDYCKSKDFRESFQFIDYIIIQIDTDVSEDYDIAHQDENGEFTPQQLIAKVIDKLRDAIGEDFYNTNQKKIIFAISVHSIECWLLPLYYTDKKKKAKCKNCLNTLNDELSKQHNFTIDKKAKNPEYYREIAKQYGKHKVLMKHYQHNPSLKLFIEEIETRNIQIVEEDDW